MTLLKISFKNLLDKKLNSFLCVLLLTLGISIISLLLILNKQLEDKFTKNIKGIDMVVGAKGSPLQLILSSIYQIDSPTGNIPLAEFEKVAMNPQVKQAIPLSMGDNFKGFRIVGTNKKYPEHFEAKLQTGKLFATEMEVCLGHNVALETGLKVGSTFASSHGLDEEGEAHEHLFKVVGIFEANNSVLDQIIVTNLASVWEVHEEGHEETHKGQQTTDDRRHQMGFDPAQPDTEHQTSNIEHHKTNTNPQSEIHNQQSQITSALIKFRSPMGLMTVPRMVNQSSVMQSAVPAVEINRLFSLLGLGMDTLRWLAMAIILIAGVSVFVSLYNSLKERKYEMALMLTMGASRTKLFLLLLSEGLILAFLGFVAGIFCSRLGLWLISSQFTKKFHQSLEQLSLQEEEIWLLAATLFVGFLAAALPSLGVYRLNISKTLGDA